jgi:hypothetical protein
MSTNSDKNIEDMNSYTNLRGELRESHENNKSEDVLGG